jgi:Ser/Thr protein kinase RdoA (MazF antagonist)
VKIRRIKRGLVNQTFHIDTSDRQRHILRLYHPDITTDRIQKEHELLLGLDRVGFTLSPSLILPDTGETWKTLATPHSGHHHMALMTCLPGEDRFRWDAPPLSPSAAVGLGDALARYHSAVWGWPPNNSDPRANETQVFQRLAKSLGEEPLAMAALAPLASVLAAMDRREWPALIVHGDYHAANVRWSADRICGIFDFEYAGLNWRLYDVGMAGAYLATDWGPSNEGVLRRNLMQAFLHGYEATLAIGSPLPPLLTGEKAALPRYLELAHLLTLEWALTPGTQRRLGVATAHRYTRHAKKALEWLRQRDAPI